MIINKPDDLCLRCKLCATCSYNFDFECKQAYNHFIKSQEKRITLSVDKEVIRIGFIVESMEGNNHKEKIKNTTEKFNLDIIKAQEIIDSRKNDLQVLYEYKKWLYE